MSDAADEIFLEARELTDPEERAAFLKEACHNNPDLLSHIQRLLADDLSAESYFAGMDSEDESVKTHLSDAPPPRLPGEQEGQWIGRYRLVELIGEGGFGSVWKAEQTDPVTRVVALKIIKEGMDTREVIARFEAERQALAMMDHPNIAKVLDAGATDTGRPFFVMELVNGLPVTEFCNQQQLDLEQRLKLFSKICSAVHHAHQKGIIHRDLKPSNVMVALHEDKPVPMVIDFGIAKATETKLTAKTYMTRCDQFIGTPAYMSPEQASMSGLDIDTRSDIYSLGILLYELVTGKPPFDAQTLLNAGFDEMRRIIVERDPPRPSVRLGTTIGDEAARLQTSHQANPVRLSRFVRGDLDWIVMKAISKDREQRYQNASDLSSDIRHYLADEPVLATPPSAMYRLRKAWHRNKVAFIAAAAMACVLITASVVSLWQAKLAREAAQESLRARMEATEKAAAEKASRVQAETITKYLMEVFRSPQPNRDGYSITVAESLGKATKTLEQDFAAQPKLLAQLQATIGETYQALGLFLLAIPLQEKAAAFYRAEFGPDHRDTMHVVGSLAWSYTRTEHKEQALALRQELLELTRARVGSDHANTARALFSLCGCLGDVGRREEALESCQEALRIFRLKLGTNHLSTLKTMASLANCVEAVGRHDEAMQLREEVLPLLRKVVGPEDDETARAQYSLAISYQRMGRHQEAVSLCEQALDSFRKLLGPEHISTLKTMAALANCYQSVGRNEEALALRETAQPLFQKVVGLDNSNTIAITRQLATSYLDKGRVKDSLSLLASVGHAADALPRLASNLNRNPGDTIAAMQLAALQVWMGEETLYVETCREMLQWAAGTKRPEVAERVGKLCSLHHIPDSFLRKAAMTLGRLALEMEPKSQNLPWYQLAAGMAEYRAGDYVAAHANLLAAANTSAQANISIWVYHIMGTAGFYRAMTLYQQGKSNEARVLFRESAAKMKPLPADEQGPLAKGADHDDLILWLAYKEAKALLQEPDPVQP